MYIKIKYLPFEEAREFARELGLDSGDAWSEYCKSGKKPKNIPSCPDYKYKNSGWISFRDWLNYEFLSYKDARSIVSALGLKDIKEWVEYSKNKRPKNIPSSPNTIYKDSGWIDWFDWLGKDKIETKIIEKKDKIEYLSFKEAREIIRKFKFKNINEFREYKKNTNDLINIPYTPNHVYKDSGWIDWFDWLGNTSTRKFLSFEDAKEIILKLGLKYKSDWEIYKKSGKKPFNIPSKPDEVYKNKGWINWPDFLGNLDIIIDYNFISFYDAKKIIRKLDIRHTSNDWKNYIKSNGKFSNIPSSPNRVYKNMWISWTDFLGYKFETFDRMSAYCLKNNITTAEQYYEHWEKYPDCGLPYNPIKYYGLK